MRQAVRAIITKDDQLLVMHRNKFGTEYDTLPGGGLEMGEQAEEALAREIAEETGITFANPRLVYIEEAGSIYGTQLIYLCDYVSGEPQLHPASEELAISRMGKNLYEPRWVPIAQLHASAFFSERLKRELVRAFEKGSFPTQTTRL